LETENLQVGTVSMASDWISDVWNTASYRAICFELSWTASNSTTGLFEIQVSVSKDEPYWSCYGASSGTVATTVGQSHGHIEVKDITFPYWRVKYTHNSVSAGIFVIRSYGKLALPRT
jgi:hypothetical protein